MSKLTKEQKHDLEALEEIYNSSGLSSAMKDGAWGYEFYDEDLQEAFLNASEAGQKIENIYDKLLNM